MEFIGFALPALVLILGGIYLPVLIDIKRRQANSHGKDRFSAGLRVLNTRPTQTKRDGYRITPPVLGGSMQRPVAPTQRDQSELNAAKLRRAQQIQLREQAARRRLTLLTVQFAVMMVLVTAAFVISSFSWLWVLIPLATITATLGLGVRAAKAGRENDQRALEYIHSLEARPAKGHRMSESEKKFAQITAKAKASSQGEAVAAADVKENQVTLGAQAKTETALTQSCESYAKENLSATGKGRAALAKMADAARRASMFREIFTAGQETQTQAATAKSTETEESTLPTKVAGELAYSANETSIATSKLETVSNLDAQPALETKAISTLVSVEKADEISAVTNSAHTGNSAANKQDSASLPAVSSGRAWTPTPMPKPIYALKPRLARRDVDASELLSQHLASRSHSPYRPSRPQARTEESLTTAQLIAQTKPVDVEAILDSRRVAN